MGKVIKTGVVATREKNGQTEVLLVSTKNKGWGVPKGNLMPELGKKKTALEEAYEEAGVLGEINGGKKATIEHPDWTLDLYPMKISKLLKKWPEMDWREREWVPLKKINKKLGYQALVECVEELAG